MRGGNGDPRCSAEPRQRREARWIKGGVWLPEPAVSVSGGFSYLQIDASGEKVAFIVKAPKAGSIRKIGVLMGTVATGATLDARIETVDAATGNPTGVLWQVGPPGTRANLAIASADDNVWKTSVNLDTDAVVQANSIFAVVLAYVAPANLALAASGLAVNTAAEFPYTNHFTSSWTKSSYSPIVGLEYSDGSFAVSPGVYPVTNVNAAYYSTPIEIALTFKLRAPTRVAGFWLWAQMISTTDARVQLYEAGNNTPLTSVTIDGGITSVIPSYLRSEAFSSPVTLKAGVVYRLSVLPTAGSVLQCWFDVNSAALMDAFAGGQDFFWSQRTRSSTTDPDTNPWSDTLTRRPLVGLILDQFSDGTLEYFDVTSFRLAGNVGRCRVKETFISREFHFQKDLGEGVLPPEEVRLERVEIGDGAHHPPHAVEQARCKVFVASDCLLRNYELMGIEWWGADGTYTIIAATNTDFLGNRNTSPSFDIAREADGSGQLNRSRRIRWLGNRRSNSGNGGALFTQSTSPTLSSTTLGTTRDASIQVYADSATPSGGNISWSVGDVVANDAPTSGGYYGWVCTTAGAPGTWKQWGAIA